MNYKRNGDWLISAIFTALLILILDSLADSKPDQQIWNTDPISAKYPRAFQVGHD